MSNWANIATAGGLLYLLAAPQSRASTQVEVRKGVTFGTLAAVQQWTGGMASWSPTDKVATLSANGHIIEMTVGSKVLTAEGNSVKLPAEPYVVAGLVYVPLVAVRSCGIEVSVDQAMGQVRVLDLRSRDSFDIPLTAKITSVPVVEATPDESVLRLVESAIGERKKGQPEKAVSNLRAALKVAPTYVPARLELAAALSEAGSVDEAYKLAKRITNEAWYYAERRRAAAILAKLKDSVAKDEPVEDGANASAAPPLPPGVQYTGIMGTWSAKEVFSTGERRAAGISRYSFWPDGSGQFAFGWPDSATDLRRFRWTQHGDEVDIHFIGGSHDGWSAWVTTLKVSLNEKSLTVSGADIRAVTLALYQSFEPALSEGGAPGLCERCTRRAIELYGSEAPAIEGRVRRVFASLPETGGNLADILVAFGAGPTALYSELVNGSAPINDGLGDIRATTSQTYSK